MSSHKKRRSRKAKSIKEEKPPIPNRLQELRERVWNCMGIVSCVEYASDSMLKVTERKPDIQQTMVVLFDMLGEISGPLEDVIDELGGVVEADDE
jgi:hypothetical protein